MTPEETTTPVEGEAVTKAQAAEVTPLRTVHATSQGIEVKTEGKDIKIDDVVNGVINRGIHNYWTQVMSEFKPIEPEIPSTANQEEVNKIIEETTETNAKRIEQFADNVKKQFIFKVKAMTYMAYQTIIGEFDEVTFNQEVYTQETEALSKLDKQMKDEAKAEVKKTTKKAKKKSPKKDA